MRQLVTLASWRAVDALRQYQRDSHSDQHVRDTTAPVIGDAGGNATIECPATPSFTAPTASDACGTSTVVQDGDNTAAGTLCEQLLRDQDLARRGCLR